MAIEQNVQRELTPADYIAMFRRRWVLIVTLTLIGPPLAYGISRVIPSQYKSQTLVLVEPPSVSTTIVPQVDTISVNERLASMQQQILSRTRLEPIIHQFGLYPGEIYKRSMDELVARLQKAIEVTPVQPMAETQRRDLPGFFVSVTLDDPHTAQGVCTAITSMFIEESIGIQEQHSKQTTEFLSQQLAEAKTDLDAQDAKLAAFKSRYIGSLPDDEQTNLNLLTGLTSQLDAANQALARAQQDKTFAESMLTQQVAAWQAAQSGHNPDTLEQQLSALETQLASLQARYTDDYPDVIKAKADIAALQKKIAESEDPKGTSDPNKTSKAVVEPAQITQWRAQVHTADQLISEKTREQEQIKQQIKLYQERVQASPVVEEQYKELTRGYQTALDSYNDLLKKRDASAMSHDLDQQQRGEQFRVLDPANLPDRPTFPNRKLFALGGLASGLGLGLGLAFLLELKDTSLKSERDVELALRLPVLAMIPAIDPVLSKKSSKSTLMRPADSNLSLGAGA
ncbi:MAG TPA: Wzz/FepE/Etk N-terminal domain-containing protein [Terriglobales bacterium]|nr:Wzz/FepE/Etk N-terminal domain-containing protein [Terriglobales bacterium]